MARDKTKVKKKSETNKNQDEKEAVKILCMVLSGYYSLL